MSQKLVPQCEGCLRCDSRRPVCVGYMDPAYQWKRFGTCPAFVTDPDKLAAEEQQAKEYFKKVGAAKCNSNKDV